MMAVSLLVLSDLLPIVSEIACMWIAKKGNWERLISGSLHLPFPDEATTEVGSHMLDGLRSELRKQDFGSEYFQTELIPDQNT